MKNATINLKTNTKERVLLTRIETAELLKVDLVTLWSWTKKGFLKSYGMGRRVFYYRDEVLGSLTELNQ